MGLHSSFYQLLVLLSLVGVFFVGFLSVPRGRADLAGWIFSLCVTCVSF